MEQFIIVSAVTPQSFQSYYTTSNIYLMTAMLKTSGYFSYLSASARQEVGMGATSR